ncbi:protein NUCLEAR FUSION DEFECTIVE 4-like [Bidens hawaiensis]|uniref:protein NUCLEAR FUSION DEFECTIVE 4-like n=1 Tax=Bidens hawaiensis TaxID=980011 RepID=UPI00404A3821
MVYYYHQCRKWMVLVAAIWIQAFAGTNFDFPSYSTEMKSSLNINQVQLLYLAMASDIGKLFGWCSGILMLWFPTWVVLFMAAFVGLVGYGAQWLIVCRQIYVPYFVMFILSLLAGGSIPWFNTVCFVVNINNFPENWPLAVSLSVSFNGVTAALYNLLITKIFPNDKSTSYVLLNAIVPFIVAIAALGPILQQPGSQNHQTDETVIKDDAHIFVCLYILAAVTGLYLFFLDLKSQNIYIMSFLLIILPFISPSIIYLIKKVHRAYYFKQQPVKGPSYNLVEFEHHEEFLEECITPVVDTSSRGGCGFNEIIEQDQLTVLGEEHSATNLVSRCDFWLYYIVYFCGGTIGLVYSNNLGQVVQSLGYISMTKPLVTTYSTCSFFGRLLSGAADLVACFYHQTYTGMYSTRTGRLSLALVPMPFAFVLLLLSDGLTVLRVATGLIGICSGFLVSTAVTITSELFGSESSRINHNILITNIPLGSLIYSVTASLVYDDHIRSSEDEEGSTVCIGRKCYYQTFILWGCVSLLGLVSSFLLSLRTKPSYERYYKERRSKQPSISDEF